MCTPLFHGIQENDSFDAFVEGPEGPGGLKSLEKRRGQDLRRMEKPISSGKKEKRREKPFSFSGFFLGFCQFEPAKRIKSINEGKRKGKYREEVCGKEILSSGSISRRYACMRAFIHKMIIVISYSRVDQSRVSM